MERAAIFVDGANMFYAQKKLGWNIDWVKLLKFIGNKYKVVNAQYYIAVKVPPSDEEKKYNHFLATNGYAIRTKLLKEIVDHETGNRIYKGNLDVELVVDALTTLDHYDHFVLLSGDGDFVALLKALRAAGKSIHCYSTRGISSLELVSELGMDYFELDDLKSQIEYVADKSSADEEKGQAQKTTTYVPDEKTSLPDLGERMTLSVLSIKEYGVFLRNTWDAKVRLHVSDLGMDQYIPDVEDIVDSSDHFEVEIIGINTKTEVPEIQVRLVSKEMIDTLKSRLKA